MAVRHAPARECLFRGDLFMQFWLVRKFNRDVVADRAVLSLVGSARRDIAAGSPVRQAAHFGFSQMFAGA